MLILCFVSTHSIAQETQFEEEVIVTGVRASQRELPGIVYNRQADYLLLKITILNDSRNEDIREQEIKKTIANAIKKVNNSKEIELSLIKKGFVVPLINKNTTIDIHTGKRPDTSQVEIRAKILINSNTKNPEQLLAKLNNFSKSINVVGRTELITTDEPEVSIVNPRQYRNSIIKLISKDAKYTTSSLGEDYRVIISGIDSPVKWVKSGQTNITMYIPYSYDVIPSNITSFLKSDY